MKDKEPLFKGGCGHSAKSIAETADAFGVILAIFLIFLIIFFNLPLDI